MMYDKDLPIMEIFWDDAGRIDGEDLTEQEIKKLKPIPRRCIGYVIQEDDKKVTLTSDITGFSHVCEGKEDTGEKILIIPKSMITKSSLLASRWD